MKRSRTSPTAPASASPCSIATASSGSASRSDDDAEGEGKGHWWQMPQGGLDKDEDPDEAALRELYEETSVKKRQPHPRGAAAGLPTTCRADLVGRPRGTAAIAARSRNGSRSASTGEEREIDVLHPGGGKHKPEFSEWRWERLDRLPELVVPFKRTVYEEVVAAFRDIPGRR